MCSCASSVRSTSASRKAAKIAQIGSSQCLWTNSNGFAFACICATRRETTKRSFQTKVVARFVLQRLYCVMRYIVFQIGANAVVLWAASSGWQTPPAGANQHLLTPNRWPFLCHPFHLDCWNWLETPAFVVSENLLDCS